MQKRLNFLAASLISVALPFVAMAQDAKAPDLGQVLATVNGTEITLGHVAVARATLPQQYQNLPADVLFPGILQQLIEQTALAQSMAGGTPDRIKLALENEERSLKAGDVVEGVMQSALKPGAVEALYESEFAGSDQGDEYNASHILVETEEQALAIKADIDAGADFAATAREKSTGPSGPNGGELGWFGPGAMVPTFEAATIALAPGEVSDPVQTQFGWHVIKLNETRKKSAPPLDEVREQLEGQLRTQAVQDYIASLTETATIDRAAGDAMDPEILNQIDILAQE